MIQDGLEVDILVFEGEAAEIACRHSLRSLNACHSLFTILAGNLSLVLAMGKARSNNVSLQCLIKRVAVFAVATDSKLHLSWIPGEWNPADGPSCSSVGFFAGRRSGPSHIAFMDIQHAEESSVAEASFGRQRLSSANRRSGH